MMTKLSMMIITTIILTITITTMTTMTAMILIRTKAIAELTMMSLYVMLLLFHAIVVVPLVCVVVVDVAMC